MSDAMETRSIQMLGYSVDCAPEAETRADLPAMRTRAAQGWNLEIVRCYMTMTLHHCYRHTQYSHCLQNLFSYQFDYWLISTHLNISK